MNRSATFFLIKPDRMSNALRVDHQRWPVMGAAIDLPAVKGGSFDGFQCAIRCQASDGVIAFVRCIDMAPHEKWRTVSIQRTAQAAAFAGMVGQLEFWLKNPAAVVGNSGVDA